MSHPARELCPVAPGPSRAPHRTVLADDSADLRLFVRVALERSGHFTVVGEAGDGREAVELVRALQPDLVVLDVSMPILDGLAAVPLVQAASPSTAVAMLSGLTGAEARRAARAAGVSTYLQKGLPIEKLTAALLAVVEGSAA